MQNNVFVIVGINVSNAPSQMFWFNDKNGGVKAAEEAFRSLVKHWGSSVGGQVDSDDIEVSLGNGYFEAREKTIYIHHPSSGFDPKDM